MKSLLGEHDWIVMGGGKDVSVVEVLSLFHPPESGTSELTFRVEKDKA